MLKLAGANHAGIRFFQALLDAGSCVLLCRVAAAFFPAPVPLVAGLFAALYWPFIFFSGELLATGLVLFLELALVLALLRCRKRPSAGNAAAAGLLLGLLVLTRSNTLLLLPVAGWWLYRVKTSRRHVYLRQQQHDLAHQALLPALHAYPDDPDVFNSLGVVYEHQDLPQKAEAAFGRALQYAPDHTRARINLGKLYFRRQRLDEALATLQEALPHDSRKEARYEVNYQLGLVYLQRQEYERALHST